MIWWLWLATLVSFLGSLFYVLMGLAPEASQGFVQKIFFFHVPAAFTMYAFLFVAFGSAVGYLVKRTQKFDQVSRASMICALGFATIVILSGPIWAKPIWGVYWTWDPRLTTTFVVFVLLVAYHIVRQRYEEQRMQERGALLGAILAILAVLDVPLIHLSVQLWRGVHPSVLRNPQGLPEDFQRGLEAMILAFFLLGGCFYYVVWHYLEIRRRVKEKNA